MSCDFERLLPSFKHARNGADTVYMNISLRSLTVATALAALMGIGCVPAQTTDSGPARYLSAPTGGGSPAPEAGLRLGREQRAETAANLRPHAVTVRASDQGRRVLMLLAQLQSNDPAARTCAVTDLGFLPTHRAQIVPPLSRAVVHDKSKWVRRAAVKSLAKIAPREAIPLLEVALRDSDRWVQHSAARALAQLRSGAPAKR